MYTLYWGLKKILSKACLLFNCFLIIKGILKALFSFIPWLFNFSVLPNYGWNTRKRYTLRLLSKCLVRSTLIKKLAPDFKNHMRNLDNFRQAVERPKSWNSMGYICLKPTFLQLKHYIPKIYLTLLSTTCVKIHQILYVVLKTISHFSRHNSSILF